MEDKTVDDLARDDLAEEFLDEYIGECRAALHNMVTAGRKEGEDSAPPTGLGAALEKFITQSNEIDERLRERYPDRRVEVEHRSDSSDIKTSFDYGVERKLRGEVRSARGGSAGTAVENACDAIDEHLKANDRTKVHDVDPLPDGFFGGR